VLTRHVILTDFRNYLELDLELTAGATVIVGKNGQGKTNLIEAINFLSTLGSHRVSTDHAMIRAGQASAIIRAQLADGERALLAEVQINRDGPNRAQINRSPIKLKELPRYFSSVLFAPEDLALVRGEPSGRRTFLDQLLARRNPRLAGVLADYDRVLRQRNTLLKTARTTRRSASELTTLDIWDARLVEFGSEIVLARAGLVAELSPFVVEAYTTVAGTEHDVDLDNALSIDAENTAADASRVFDQLGPIVESFTAAIAANRRAELDRGVTLVGPHRDDLTLTLNGLPARGYASHGESWSFALALKLASAQLLRADSQHGDPVLILDDVFAELDAVRRERLGGAIKDFEQVLITAAVLGDVPSDLSGRTVGIADGRVVETGAE
jgi:DNA replication and repair protein RecF